jgi:hypothetical protein
LYQNVSKTSGLGLVLPLLPSPTPPQKKTFLLFLFDFLKQELLFQ